MEPSVPTISLVVEDGSEVLRRTVKFQCGLLRETETFVGDAVEALCRDTLQDSVCNMLNMKVSQYPLPVAVTRSRAQ